MICMMNPGIHFCVCHESRIHKKSRFHCLSIMEAGIISVPTSVVTDPHFFLITHVLNYLQQMSTLGG